MAATKWKAFGYDATSYGYEGAALKKAWPELHRGDCEPFPDAAFVKQALAAHPRLKCSLSADQAAAALQSAWRAYHRGDFGAAVAEGAASDMTWKAPRASVLSSCGARGSRANSNDIQ